MYLVWVNTGTYGWWPIPCETLSMGVLCYKTLRQTGVPVFAIVLTRQITLEKTLDTPA